MKRPDGNISTEYSGYSSTDFLLLTIGPNTENCILQKTLFRGAKSICLPKYLVLFEDLAAIDVPELERMICSAFFLVGSVTDSTWCVGHYWPITPAPDDG
jgi:hypothetical protein